MDADRETVELFAAWHAGEEPALHELVRRNLDWITRVVRRRLGDELRHKAETADFVQDAIVEMLRYGPRFSVRHQTQLRALLARIVENVLRGKHEWFHRERRAMSRERPPPSGGVLDVAASQTTPSEAAVRSERGSWIRLALEMLPATDREIVLLREWRQRSFAEAARELGISEDAARMRFQRALPRLARVATQLRDGDLETALRETAT